MIFEPIRKQRNYNYLNIIKNYNLIFKSHYNEKNVTKEDFYFLCKNLIGDDTVDNIWDSLVLQNTNDDYDDKSLELFSPSDDKNNSFSFIKDSEIQLPPTKEEVTMIYSMLKNGDFDLFLDKEKTTIENNIKKYFENINLKEFNLFNLIDIKGLSHNGDNLSDIKEKFDTLNKAINKNNSLCITYNIDEKEYTCKIKPICFIYSQLDHRMRVKAYIDNIRIRTFYLSFISNISIIDDIPTNNNTTKKIKTLKFSFINEKNHSEKFAARFSDYDKKVIFDKKSNTVYYTIEYQSTPLEKNRIINRLLSLGNSINIESEEKEIIKEIAKKALDNYRKTVS